MVARLQTARSAAISNRASSAVCPSSDGVNCAASLGNRWIAVMTKNGVSTVLRDSTMHSSILLKASANLSGGSNKFTFTPIGFRSEEHTSELQSLMRISYAVFCLKKKQHNTLKY